MIRMREFSKSLKEFNIQPISIRTLNINTVYRTENAHSAYKSKNIYGNGLYTSLSIEEAKEYTLDPNSEFVVYYDPSIHGKIDRYSVLKTMRVVVFNLDENSDFNKFTKIQKEVGKDNLREFFLDNNVQGLVIYSDSLNYGGNQLVVYDRNYIR